jgi:release factor glutamine methyltransferase
MMRAADVVRRGAAYLQRHDVQSPLPTAELLMMHVLDTDRSGVYVHDHGLTTAEARAYGRLICRRCTGTPAQHLTGRQAFRTLNLAVRPGVFIPRPETEIVVERALRSVQAVAGPTVVDVGTGTGAIALSVKCERPDARVIATDRSADAVDLARANAAELGVDVEIVRGDLLSALPGDLRRRVDLVVSNPPYVTRDELAVLPTDVLADPVDSLLGGPQMYARLLPEAFSWLADSGRAVVEIGERQAEDVTVLAARAGFVDVAVHVDLAGRNRVVSARRP